MRKPKGGFELVNPNEEQYLANCPKCVGTLHFNSYTNLWECNLCKRLFRKND